MENRANYAIVGLFALAVLAGAFGFVYWFRRAGENADRKSYQLVFTGSVSGLSRGSVVRFNGLRVGEVTAIEIMASDPSKVVAVIEVDAKTPMKTDTRARLESQGLTGVSSVQLTGGAAQAPDLVSPDPKAQPTIFADRSDFQDILETLQRLSAKVDGTLTRVDSILASSEGSIVSTLRNVEAFSKALSDNSSGVGQFLANVSEMSQRVGTLSTRLERFVDTAEELVRGVDVASVNRTLGNVEQFSQALGESKATISALIADAGNLVKGLGATTQRIDGAVDEVMRLSRAFDMVGLNRAIGNIEEFSQTLGESRGGVAQIISDAGLFLQRLSGSADRLDAALDEVTKLGRSVDVPAINRTIANAEAFTGALGDNRAAINELIGDAGKLAKSLNASTTRLDQALDEVTKLTRAIDAEKLNRTLDGAEKFASALGKNAETIDSTIREIADIAGKVGKAADRLDNVMAGAESFLGGGQGGQTAGMMAEITEAAKSIRALASNLDKRTVEITAGINRFTGPGLRDIEALAAESRKAVGDLSRAVRSLERNPSQVLFGGQSPIPDYRRR